jgi:CHAT domain-containing protein
VQHNPAASFFGPDDRIELTGYCQARHGVAVATAAALKATVAAFRPSCFSFYGHGGWDSSDPENSAIYLAAPRNATGDVPMEFGPHGERTAGVPFGIADLGGLDLSACRIAVLAGCETGMIDLKKNPDEFFGLPAALLQAGAAGVMATLWPVEAASTYAMVAFTLNAVLKDGLAPVHALRQAQLRLRDYPDALARVGNLMGPVAAAASRIVDVCPRSAAFWAGFTYVGA